MKRRLFIKTALAAIAGAGAIKKLLSPEPQSMYGLPFHVVDAGSYQGVSRGECNLRRIFQK